MKQTKQLLCFCAMISLFSCGDDTNNDNDTINDLDTNIVSSELDETASVCPAPSSWFDEDGNGNRRTLAPLEGSTSPFAVDSTVTNCDFQQWSWQKFLWLTNEYNGRPLFIDSLHQITAQGIPVADPSLIVLIDTSQASNATLDILQTPNLAGGTPPQTTVYSAIFQDETMYNTMITYAPIGKADRTAIEDVAYPVGSLELKTTWIATSGLTDTSDYFITDGTINGVPNRVALLAMHVVGVVENHPEFIWATFEHDALTPDYDWDAATDTSDALVTSNTDYPFFGAGQTATTANITSGVADGPHTNVFGIYPYGIPLEKSASNQLEYMATSQTNPENVVANIEALNQSVKSQLSGVWNKYFLNGSLWLNTGDYSGLPAQIALLNSLGGTIGQVDPGKLPRGSVAAYNITMETYVQAGFRSGDWKIHDTEVGNLANCFSCHSASDYISSTEIYQSPLYISHIFTGYMGTLKGLNREEIKEYHAIGINAQFVDQKDE